jgi:16S rRNA (adenine1518-N6/adenine1519-N6)-dimethyltransferase
MRARKRFGQHFLHDQQVLRNIASAMSLRQNQRVFEIGPGQGALTEYLFDDGLTRYLAVEIDRDLAPLLGPKFPGIEVLQQDILKTDLGKILTPSEAQDGWRVVGNLPYNISSPLLMQLIDHVLACPNSVRDMHFMLQKEMAQRLTAVPGTKAWGRLSVMTQVTLDTDYLFDVPPESFRPPPKVDSAVIRLTPKPDCALPVRRKSLDQVLRLAFAGRRKRLSNALKNLNLDWQQVPVDPALRADDVTIEGFIALAGAADSAEAQSG